LSHCFRVTVLAALGAVAALGPMVVSNSVIRWVAIEQGTAQMQSMTKTILAHSEMVLDVASDALSALSRGGMVDCSQNNIALIDETVFTNLSLKEIGIYDADDQINCTNFGATLVAMSRVNSLSVKGGQLDISIVPTRVADDHALGLRRDADNGAGGLIAMIETETVLMKLLHGKMRKSYHARVELADGTLIRTAGQTREAVVKQDSQMVESKLASARYPIVVAVAAPRIGLLAPFLHISNYAKFGSGILGVILLGFVVYSIRYRTTLEAEIDAAIASDEFVPYYQPILDANEGCANGCEMLLRWRKPNGDLVCPEGFIPFAEATGQIIPISRHMLARVSEDLVELCAENEDFMISFNLVAEHFDSLDIVEDVKRVCAKGQIKPKNLVFEVTERRPLTDLATSREVMRSLQALGCKIGLDDAGTGHCGLAYIQQLGMDTIKIDRMFVAAIGNDSAKAPVVDALIELGKELNMKIVAEGVETDDQFNYLRARGVRYFQGYLFSQPLPKESFYRFVQAFELTSDDRQSLSSVPESSHLQLAS